ncbi:MAG: hypothetical protein L0Z48_00590 [candidate division Zixibacteria bacterium]|nr:hypothetical protein [candidate division Zixibacteria bacterium]MCI0595021.1 hypothetical protein [candidate division Zixibacteria bacterium]
MRNLLFLGLLAVALLAFGCGSNQSGNITGPANTTQAEKPASQQRDFDWQDEYIGPPKPIELESAAPPAPDVLASPGFYGTVSNLSAAGFTLTSPDGRTYEVTVTPETNVLYQGTMTNLGDSPLENGLNVSINGIVAGLPGQSRVRALLIVINASFTNQGLIAVD